MADLTRGAIPDIIEGKQPVDPILQILSMKKIPSGVQERYRLLVSDGQWSSSFAMLATQLNNLVNNGEISNNCVIRMKRYICNTVQDNKKVLIILDLEILKTGEEIGQKIGEPTNFDPNKARSEQVKQPSFQSRPSPVPAASGGNARPPLAQHNYQSQSTGASPSMTPSGSSVHPIASLTPYQNKWTICVRVTNKSDIRTWSNSRGEGKLFSMDLLDESGEIRATGFNEQLDKFYDMIDVNKVYFITGGTLKTANKQYSRLNNDYELTLNKITEISPCQEQTAIPTMQYSFVSLDQLSQVAKDSIVDVIGVCKESLELGTVQSRATGRELKKRDLQIVDDTNHEVRITLWGTSAENFDGSLQPVMAIKGAKVSDFNGVSLSLLSSSSFQINPDIREAHKIKGWFDNGGCNSESVNLSNQRGGPSGGGIGNVFKTFSETKLENLGGNQSDQADYYSTKAAVALIRKENCLYPACPGQNCNKKVVDMNNGMYRCEKCGQEYDSFKYRLMLSVNLADTTDNQWVTMFQDQAEAVLGVSAQQLGDLRESNNDAFQKVFSEATFKSFTFRMRVKMETYNDESRLKCTAMQCTPLNIKEYNRRLINEIKQMSGQS